LGGISILGTRGTVKPFSNQAYRDTITVSMDVARSQGLSTVALATGGKSERLLRGLMPDLPDATWIQVGDFFAFSLKEAAKRGFEAILYACFFGKLVKMAQGHPHTHARKGRIDFEELASWCTAGGLSREDAAAVRRANTSREALGIIRKDPAARRMLGDAVTRAMGVARGFLGPGIVVAFYLFDFDETLLETRTEPSQERTWTP
jgi:cobalt-precorrin-5B (C1)-methyltransferase